ncbi:PAS and ANTAR domain-containing protein [Phycicoccus sp. Root101]|uniref:PAS and ANTAR domain-containing protein n=1 Tax=Phycicoccus sp. Root101 TaxID=1736421 RepID=UPI000702D8BD|nr:PAS and ANTAR domain-containing protein [Phycicoccus sp. Root101]KQU68949.1 hypothetical protein ASC58_09870 [Phycicoccus sp. Root101]
MAAEFAYDALANRWTWSANLRELHGLSPDAAPTTEHLVGVVHADDKPAMLDRLHEHLRTAGAYTHVYRVTDAHGRSRRLRLVAKSTAKDDRVLSLHGFVLDVTNDVQTWQTDAIDQAMQHRAAIEQAKGALMLAFHIDDVEAFDMLRAFSSRQNRRLADVAAYITASLSDPTFIDPDPVQVLLEIVAASAVQPVRQPHPQGG